MEVIAWANWTVKVAVITAATSAMALATADCLSKRARVSFITCRKQDKLDEAVKTIDRQVTGVQADSGSMASLDRLYEIVRQKKGHSDVLFASAGLSGQAKLGEITEQQFDEMFHLNARGALFTV